VIYHKTYPTGRKHCSRCGRWRLITDFSVREWLNEKKDVPASFSSTCRVCDARRTRGPNGKAREYHYRWKTTEYQRQKKKENWRNTKNDPVRLARAREYHRFWSNAKRREAGRPEMPQKGSLVYLVATEYGAQRLYYKRGKDGKPVVNWKRKIVDPALVGVGSRDSS
jgi:hypothetical protein